MSGRSDTWFLLCHLLLLVALSSSQEIKAQATDSLTTPSQDSLYSAHSAPDLQHLRLDLQFNVEQRAVGGEAVFSYALPGTSLDSLYIAARNFVIDSLLVRQQDTIALGASYKASGDDSLLVRWEAPPIADTLLNVHLFYSATPKSGLHFSSSYQETASPQLWSDPQPATASHWIPLPISRADAATVEWLVTVKPPLRVFASGRSIEEVTNEDSTVTYHFIQDDVPYITPMALVIGAFDVQYESLRLPGNRSVVLSYWAEAMYAQDIERTFGNTSEALDFLSSFLGTPYPHASYSQIVFNRPPFGPRLGMGFAAFSEEIVLDERAANDEIADPLIAHFLTHQWMRDANLSGKDAWLHEGLATYASALFQEQQGDTASLARQMQALRDSYLQGPTPYALTDSSQWKFSPDRDEHTAPKAAWTLHMLRQRVGDSAFKAILTRLLSGDHEAPDFSQIAASEAELQLTQFFSDWVQSMGHPELNVSYDFASNQASISFTVEQTQTGLGIPEAFHFDLPVEVLTLDGVQRFTLPVRQKRQQFSFPLVPRPRAVVVDPNVSLLGKIEVSQPVRAWVAQLRQAPSESGRLEAARYLANEDENPALLLALRSALSREPSAIVRAAIATSLGRFLPSTSVFQALLEAANDESSMVRVAALDALATTRDTAVHSLAFQLAQEDASYRVQAAAVRALARTDSPMALDVLRSALVTPSHKDVIRLAAMDALLILDLADQDVIAILAPMTEANHAMTVRLEAIKHLGVYLPPSSNVMDLFSVLVEDSSMEIRYAAVRQLLHFDPREGRTLLAARAALEPEPWLRRYIEHNLDKKEGVDR